MNINLNLKLILIMAKCMIEDLTSRLNKKNFTDYEGLHKIQINSKIIIYYFQSSMMLK